MASLFKRLKKHGALASPFWWCKFTDAASGTVRRESTGCRIGDGAELRRALKFQAEKTLAELQGHAARKSTRFALWVPQFLETRYANPLTRARMVAAWSTLQIYLNAIQVFGPEQLRRQQCQDYVTWREQLKHGRRLQRTVNRNTIILELKCLGLIMAEAVQRGWLEYNVTLRLGIQRARVAPRGEILPQHDAIICAAIAERCRRAQQSGDEQQVRNADFLRVSYEIAMRSGMRQGETYFHLRDQVDFAAGGITLHAKGREDYTAPIGPELEKFLRELIAEGREWTYARPRMPSLVWFKFLDGLRRKHPELRTVHFHGSRAAVTSRLEEAGAPEAVVMKMLNHASTTVHRKYRRVKGRELDSYWKALKRPSH